MWVLGRGPNHFLPLVLTSSFTASKDCYHIWFHSFPRDPMPAHLRIVCVLQVHSGFLDILQSFLDATAGAKGMGDVVREMSGKPVGAMYTYTYRNMYLYVYVYVYV
jgi:hypothetical protein